MDQITSLNMDSFRRIQAASLIIGNKTYSIYNGVNSIGRNKTAVVNIKHLNISQNQALIVIIDETQHYISDMNSSNGTFLIDTKLTPFRLYSLTNNAKIKFGNVTAIYSKIATNNATVNVRNSLNVSEMTQNMTQNFYASNTQLILNDVTVSDVALDHIYSNAETLNVSVDIHEEATQVVDNPQILPKVQNQLVTAVHQTVNNDIHDVPTQVFNNPKSLDTQGSSEDIHEALTQVADFANHIDINIIPEHIKIDSLTVNRSFSNSPDDLKESESKSSNSNTQVLTTEEKQEIESRIITKNNALPQILIKESEESEEKHCHKNQSHEVQMTNGNKIEQEKKEKIHDSQEPSTSKLEIMSKMEYDESFLNSPKKTKDDGVFIEETIMNNSNDSIDFLVIESTQNEKVNKKSAQVATITNTTSNSQVESQTQIESTQDMFKTVAKPVPKLPNTPSECESDIENTQDIGFRRKPLKPILENSDSETDIETSQKSVPKISNVEEKQKAVNSDSETDCEDETVEKPPAKLTVTNDISDSDTEIEKNADNQYDLDDTDCIPATQQESRDAFAEALGYKPIKSSQTSTNQSSEDSFKLGLTELMNFSQNNIVEDLEKEEHVSNEQSNHRSRLDDNQNTVVNKKFTFKKKTVNLENSLTTILSTNKANKDDIQTQNVEITYPSTDDNIFLKPAQLLKLKKSDAVFSKPADKDDPFLQSTQVVNVEDDSGSGNTQLDDLYLAPTQDNVYLAPTQDDMYLASTQVIEGSSCKVTSLSMTQEDMYEQATQKIENIPVCSSSMKIEQETQDPYMQPTQLAESFPNAGATDSQLEIENFNENVEFEFTTGIQRVENPLLRELGNENPQEVNTPFSVPNQKTSKEDKKLETNTSSSNDRCETVVVRNAINKNTTETLSEVEDFIKAPLLPKRFTRKAKCIPAVDNTKNGSKDNVETMSQIEAFVKAPLKVSEEQKSVIQQPINVEDTTETLSQISTFINNSQPKVKQSEQSLSKAPKENEKVIETSTSSTSARVSKRLSSKKLEPVTSNISRQLLEERSRDNEDETERKNSSREMRSDIDQSFALLESKSVKVRRKPSDPILDKIQVTVTSHRRSMNTAENSDTNPELVIPRRKSKRSGSVNASGTPDVEPPPKISKTRTEDENKELGGTIRDSSNSEVPLKNGRTGKLIRTSTPNLEVQAQPSRTRKSKVLPAISEENSNINKDVCSTKTNRKKTNGQTNSCNTPEHSKVQQDDIKVSGDTTKSNKIVMKQQIVKSSEDDVEQNRLKTKIVQKRHNTYQDGDASASAKYSRTSRKASNIISDDASSKDGESSDVSDAFATPKKQRNTPQLEVLINSIERKKRKLKPKVAFTMLDSPQLETFIRHLGGSIVDSINSATILITQNVKRSQKLLVAVAQGKPICGPNWVQESKKINEFLDPWDYILTDKEAEAKWNFSLKESLKRAENNKLLTDYTFQLLVSNATDVLKGAIEASGGKCITKVPSKNERAKFIVVASADHKVKYNKLKKQYPEITIIEPEGIFDGVLRQELKLSKYIVT